MKSFFQKKQLAIEGREETKEVNRFESAIIKSKFEEKIRMKFNNHAVTWLSYFNVGILLPLGLWTWTCNLFGFFDFSLFNYVSWFLFIPLWILPYLTWQYSTIAVPIMDGHKIKRDWSKTKKGRWKSAMLNLAALHVMTWCAASKYIVQFYSDYLTSIRLKQEYAGIVLQDDLDSLILVLFVAPVVFSGLAIFLQVRDYMINKDLLNEHFLKWEAPVINRFAHQYEVDKCDVIVGFEVETKKPIVLKEERRYLHESVVGATGSGKTSTTILLRIAQDLIKIATGQRKMGLVLLEPKGDAVDDVLTICKKLGIPDEKIKVIDPTKSWSVKYNPFAGTRDSAAQSFQGTLNALTGDQDEFFKGQQNEAASSYTLLAKIHYGNLTNVFHIQQMFTDPRYLADIVESVRKTINHNRHKTDLTPHQSAELDSFEQVVSYFENEVIDYKTYRVKDDIQPVYYPPGHKYEGRQMVENKKDKFVTGAKKYLNEIALNSLLKTLFVCNDGEEAFDADEFLKEGGVVLVNTALAELEELSLMFGQFFIRQFQSAVFRRAKEDKEQDIERIPIFLYIDEFPLYANEAFERFLTLGRSYNVGTLIAMQSIAQLDAISEDFRKSILGNASNKTVFGRGPKEDNEYFSVDFGEYLVIDESSNESGSPITSDNQIWGYRLNAAKKLQPRFSVTDIKELPFKQMIVQVVDETNSLDKPRLAIGQFVHESPMIKRYMELSKDEIKSTVERPIAIEGYMNQMGVNIAGVTSQHSILPPEGLEQLEALGIDGNVSNEMGNSETTSNSMHIPIPVEVDAGTETATVSNKTTINDLLDETDGVGDEEVSLGLPISEESIGNEIPYFDGIPVGNELPITENNDAELPIFEKAITKPAIDQHSNKKSDDVFNKPPLVAEQGVINFDELNENNDTEHSNKEAGVIIPNSIPVEPSTANADEKPNTNHWESNELQTLEAPSTVPKEDENVVYTSKGKVIMADEF